MTVRFAAARSAARSPLARAFSRRPAAVSANDNGELAFGSDLTDLVPALRHFARHGLGAAVAARCAAEEALACGEVNEYGRWLAICRSFDRRMAADVERKSSPLIGEAIEAAGETAQR